MPGRERSRTELSLCFKVAKAGMFSFRHPPKTKPTLVALPPHQRETQLLHLLRPHQPQPNRCLTMGFGEGKSNPPHIPPGTGRPPPIVRGAGTVAAGDAKGTRRAERPLGAEETDSPAPNTDPAPSVDAPGVIPPAGTMVRPEKRVEREREAASSSRREAARRPRRPRPGEGWSDIARGGRKGESLHEITREKRARLVLIRRRR